jgi:hypothetical protein
MSWSLETNKLDPGEEDPEGRGGAGVHLGTGQVIIWTNRIPEDLVTWRSVCLHQYGL